MRAAIHNQYGSPGVVRVMEVPKPLPGDNEILVRVHSSTVNRTDSGFRSAAYFISRFWTGLFRPKFKILGCEFSGTVEAIGKNVTTFICGDKVFGFNDKTFGGHAEYLTIAEMDAVTKMPDNIGFDEAAAITEGGHYALVDIRAAKVTAGQKVMVYGATGAIGSAAVQLLKHFGAIVTAVGNTKNVGLVKSLGADSVIDYEQNDFTAIPDKFDFILDAVGKSSYKQCKPLLAAKGIYISTEFGKHGVNIWLALTTPLRGGKKLLFPLPSISKEDINFLKELVENGKFKPIIDRRYSLDQIVEAHQYVDSEQKTGNVVIKIVE